MLEWRIAEYGDGLVFRLTASAAGIRSIQFRIDEPAAGERNDYNPLLEEAHRQLRAYFDGDLREFQLPLDMVGTEFQIRVWKQLETIPYGEFRSYAEVARAIGAPQAVRAVGAANGANPLPIVVPCHRVIGSSGKLVGYGGGLPMKKRLLELESRALPLFGSRD